MVQMSAMKYLIPMIGLLLVESSTAAPKPRQPEIVAAAKVTDTAGAEVTTLKIGEEYGYSLTATDAHLAANKMVIVSYTITVSSEESASPVSISGRLSLRATLPASEGGAAKTSQDATAAAGTQTFTGLFVVPEGLPEGDANISIVLSTGKSGTVKFKKRYVLELD